MAGHLGINVDIACAVFRKGGIPLMDLALEVTGARNMDDLARRGNLLGRLGKEFKDVNVVTTHRGDMRQRFRIGGVSEVPASEYYFEMDGERISIGEYFLKQYNYRLQYPWLPVVLKVFIKLLFFSKSPNRKEKVYFLQRHFSHCHKTPCLLLLLFP
jgi:eukaryotic translation initiation factor 2C